MTFRFLLDNVSIDIVDQLDDVRSPLYSDHFTQLNEVHFKIHIPNVAKISATNGDTILIQTIGDFDKKTIELYLNGSILGAILHQRKTLSFHGSSVAYNGKGILFCGDSGAGKSTITYGLSLQPEFDFLTDDITPIRFEDERILIHPISERLKLWPETLDNFETDYSELEIVRKDIVKYYVPIEGKKELIDLGMIFFVQISESPEIEISEIQGMHKVEYLVKNVYRYEFLEGMKATELDYFQKHAQIASTVKCYLLKRPSESDITQVINKIRTIIDQ